MPASEPNGAPANGDDPSFQADPGGFPQEERPEGSDPKAAANEEHKARLAVYYDLKRAERAPLVDCLCDLTKLTHGGFVDIIKGSVDRSIKRSEFVATAAVAVGTIYTTLVGLVFGIDSGAEDLDLFAALPGAYLALAFALAAMSLGFNRVTAEAINSTKWKALTSGVTSIPQSTTLWPTATLEDILESQLKQLMMFARDIADGGAKARILAIVSLALAVPLIPIVFTNPSNTWKWVISLISLVVLGAAASAIHKKVDAPEHGSLGGWFPDLKSLGG